MADGQQRRTILYGKVVLPDRILHSGAVLIEGQWILEVAVRDRISAANALVIEHEGYIAPGFIDLHVHGGRDADFMDGTPDAFRTALEAHARHGTTSLVATTTVADHATMLEVLRTARLETALGPHPNRLLGVHLYGPYFGREAAGCHPPDHLRDPVPSEFEEYLRFSDVIVSATVAPELPGAEAFARACRARDILVHLGHSHCTFEQAEAAIGWGARHVDHLFCAMSDRARLRGKKPFPMAGGLLEAALCFDELSTEVIADGRHLDRSLLKLAYKIKGVDRLALVTDASRAMDMPDGEYVFGPRQGGLTFRRHEGVGVLPDRSNLASSVMGMDHMVRTFHRLTGSGLHEAVRMASLTPAKILKRQAELGSLAPGKLADIVLLKEDLAVEQVWVAGRPLDQGELFDV